MISKHREMQLLVDQYRDEVGRNDVDLHEVSEWAVARGYLKPPKPVDPLMILTKEFAKALREQTKVSQYTHRSVRVNHARTETRGGKSVTLWGHIDRLGRDAMEKCFKQRRQLMVGDAVQLSDDVEHWNHGNPDEQPIQMPLDFGPDVLWSKNAPNDLAG